MIKIINILVVIVLLLALIFLSLEERRFSRKKRLQVLWGSVFFICILFGVRDFGLDIEPYRVIFTELVPLNLSDLSLAAVFNPTIEPFFVVLISIIKTAGLSYNFFLFVSAAISFILVARVIQENSVTPILCLLFFCLFFLFKAADAVRHFLAACLYLFALHLLAQDRGRRSYLLMVASCFVHYSNIIVLMIAPLLKVRWRAATYMGALVVIVLFSWPLGQILGGVSSGQDLYLIWKFNYYLNSEEHLNYQNTLHKVILFALSYFYYFGIVGVNLFMLIKKQQGRLSKFEFLVLNSQIVGSLVATLFLMLDAFVMAVRILLPLGLGSFFIFARIWKEGEGERRKNPSILYLVISILLIYNFVVILYNAGIHYEKSPFYIG